MDTAKLESWANKLLDVSKKNNLINFKDTKKTTLELLYPTSSEIFDKIENLPVFEFFDPNIDESIEDLLSENSSSRKSKKLSREEYYNKYSGRIHGANKVLGYNAENPLRTVLKEIDKKAKSGLEETGINFSYLVFGFIHYTDNVSSDIVYQAPILFVPVTLKNDSAITPYSIEINEGEFQLNYTLDYLLKQEYGIELPHYDEGSLPQYLKQIESCVSKLGWTVSSEVKIGLFSFQKLNMYDDLMTNKELILQNDTVRTLMGEELVESRGVSDCSENDSSRTLSDLHNVVDADSSQVDAIQMAKSGKSFVLQGPPGTGKSQTITNIIAECLKDGKKVLFVSEKQAALNVVYDKLKSTELEEFCLELHSHKANKKAVIQELMHTLSKTAMSVSSRANAEIDQKIRAQKELDEYEKELHEKRDVINMSLYQMYNAHSHYKDGIEIPFVIENIKNKGEDFLRENVDYLNQYVAYVPTIGYDYKSNPWYGTTIRDFSYQNMSSVKDDFFKALEACISLNQLMNELSDLFNTNYQNITALSNVMPLLNVLGRARFITPAFFEEEFYIKAFEKIDRMAVISKEILCLESSLLECFDKEIFDLDGSKLYKELTRIYNNVFKRIISSEYRKLVQSIRLCDKKGIKPKYNDAVTVMETLKRFQELTNEYNEIYGLYGDSFGDSYSGLSSDWESILDELRILKWPLAIGDISSLDREGFKSIQPELDSIAKSCKQIINSNSAVFNKINSYFNNEIFDLRNDDIDEVISKLKICIQNFDRISNWGAFSNVLSNLENSGVNKFVDMIIERNIQPEMIAVSFQRIFYKQWIDYVINQPGTVLCGFDRIVHDSNVELFCRKDKVQFEISKAQIRADLSSKRPNKDLITQGSALAILLREGEKKRKQMSIRNLFEKCGSVIQEIKPCFLMSPLSVSTYLSPEGIHFDTVVFDEASQIFPQDAIGAIYRGKQLIVVGDSQQMPPTNFFNAGLDTDDEDEEIGDVNDFESILDLCSASMSQIRLKWHYRSRFEELISFSNKNYYDGDLVTFPSAVSNKEGVGIDFIFVDGIFENRKNRVEAEKIVELVYDHFKNHPELSLGVVAFNISQQTLIEQLIDYKRRIDSEFDAFFESDKNEPFFVKNLETVQGDERDTIIFSVAYGKNPEGKFYQNFGPLNRAGGERRLNVAVTRAKINVKLVTSIHHYDIDIKDGQSTGKRLLKEYLDYAENGNIALSRSISVNEYEQFDSEFEIEVCDYLRSKGYTVDSQVGVSGYRIDLGLKRPNSSDYVLAIECDGATYHSSKNARDRDRLRQEILERMGWKFYRIWSTDWFKNTTVAKENLINAVEHALNNSDNEYRGSNELDDEVLVSEDFEVVNDESHESFPKYEMSNDTLVMIQSRNSFAQFIKTIVKNEAPVSEEWLTKRIVKTCGETRVTNYYKDKINTALKQCSRSGIERRNGFLYERGKTSYMLREPAGYDKREIKYISPEEIAGGMKVYVSQNKSLTRDGLYKAVAKALGYTRATEKMIARFDEALELIKPLIIIDGEMIIYKG